jgi:hypothetical protein
MIARLTRPLLSRSCPQATLCSHVLFSCSVLMFCFHARMMTGCHALAMSRAARRCGKASQGCRDLEHTTSRHALPHPKHNSKHESSIHRHRRPCTRQACSVPIHSRLRRPCTRQACFCGLSAPPNTRHRRSSKRCDAKALQCSQVRMVPLPCLPHLPHHTRHSYHTCHACLTCHVPTILGILTTLAIYMPRAYHTWHPHNTCHIYATCLPYLACSGENCAAAPPPAGRRYLRLTYVIDEAEYDEGVRKVRSLLT